jgi:hypothetical protein
MLTIYDFDTGMFKDKKDLLGRIWIYIEQKVAQIKSPVNGLMYTATSHVEPDWYSLLFDASESSDGDLLLGYDLIPLSFKDAFPKTVNIRPKSIESKLTMAVIGLRDIIPSLDLFPVNKVFCKFDI